jgi:Zinc binding domain
MPEADGNAALCPVSGTIGSRVDLITVKALLESEALRRLDGKVYRFCPAPDCDIVYFDNSANSIFRKPDLVVRVGQKESEEPVPICYCFGYTLADVRRDPASGERTEIPFIITREIRAGHCACEVKNPQGACCLGDVTRAIEKVRSERSARTDP